MIGTDTEADVERRDAVVAARNAGVGAEGAEPDQVIRRFDEDVTLRFRSEEVLDVPSTESLPMS